MKKRKYKVIEVPSGETYDSFLASRIEQLDEILKSYKRFAKDIYCFDNETQLDISEIESELFDLKSRLKSI